MLICTTAGLTLLATLMNARESSEGEPVGADLGATDLACGACWPRTGALLGANKPNPSETASAGTSLCASLTLFVESLNLFSIYVFTSVLNFRGVIGAVRKPPHINRLMVLLKPIHCV